MNKKVLPSKQKYNIELKIGDDLLFSPDEQKCYNLN